MSSNLPPGVNESMIPGNRPEDIAYEQAHDKIVELADDSGLDDTEIVRAMTIGIAAVKAEREFVESEIKNRVSVELFAREMEKSQ